MPVNLAPPTVPLTTHCALTALAVSTVRTLSVEQFAQQAGTVSQNRPQSTPQLNLIQLSKLVALHSLATIPKMASQLKLLVFLAGIRT